MRSNLRSIIDEGVTEYEEKKGCKESGLASKQTVDRHDMPPKYVRERNTYDGKKRGNHNAE